MIWRKGVAIIFSYVMLDIRSISSSVICNSYPKPYELQDWKVFPHIQLVFSLSFVKLLWPFGRIISYANDQDHVHIHSHAILLHLEDSEYILHPPTNKTPCYAMSISLQSYLHNVWAIKKEIKDAYPKKVCHMPTRHVKKREKRCIPKEGVPHTHKVCQKKGEKENIAHTKNITREREII